MGTSAFNMILGPIEVGNALNCVLFGTLIMQAYNYYRTFNDPKWMQWAIAFILLLDTTQTAVMIYMQWNFTVTGFMDPAGLGIPGWSIGSIPFWSVPIAWMVQWFYAWRIYQLTNRQKLIPAVVVVLSIIQGLGGLGAGIGAFMVNSTADFPKLDPVAGIWFGGSLACDLLITFTMVITLNRSRTGFKETDNLVDRVIKNVVETGMATTIIVLLDTIFFFKLSHTNMHLCVVMIAGKTYSNSMLYTLNARASMRRTGNIHTTTGVAGSGSGGARGTGKVMTTTELVFTNPTLRTESDATRTAGAYTVSGGSARPGRPGVKVDHETHIVMDEFKNNGSHKARSIPGTEDDLDLEDQPYVVKPGDV